MNQLLSRNTEGPDQKVEGLNGALREMLWSPGGVKRRIVDFGFCNVFHISKSRSVEPCAVRSHLFLRMMNFVKTRIIRRAGPAKNPAMTLMGCY